MKMFLPVAVIMIMNDDDSLCLLWLTQAHQSFVRSQKQFPPFYAMQCRYTTFRKAILTQCCSSRFSESHHILQKHFRFALDWAKYLSQIFEANMIVQHHMGEISQGVQSMEMMSYFLSFFATVFSNLEVWKVKKWNIFVKYICAGV